MATFEPLIGRMKLNVRYFESNSGTMCKNRFLIDGQKSIEKKSLLLL